METKEQQIKTRKALIDKMHSDAESETRFQNSWRKKFEERGMDKPVRSVTPWCTYKKG